MGLSALLVATTPVEAKTRPGAALSPIVASVGPAAGQGAIAWVVNVSGAGFTPQARLSFPGAGVSVAKTIYLSSSRLTAVIRVAAVAPVGLRGATVTNPDGASGTCESCFTVDAGPRPESALPASGVPGATLLVMVMGSGFQDHARASFGTGISTVSIGFKSSNEIDLTIRISASASRGPRTIGVVNGHDGGRGQCPGCFSVAPTPGV